MNQILLVSIISLILAQLIKFPIYYIKHHKFYLPIIISTGSMPSSHTAFVVSLATSIGIVEGVQSSIFALGTVFAMITLHDAVMVRGESGKHAILLNELVIIVEELGDSINLKNTKEIRQEKLKTLIGHSFSEVFAGFVLGLVWPFIYFLVIV